MSQSKTQSLVEVIINVVVNSILYFMHERMWNQNEWGKQINEKI